MPTLNFPILVLSGIIGRKVIVFTVPAAISKVELLFGIAIMLPLGS